MPVLGVFAVPRDNASFFRSKNVVFTGAGERSPLSPNWTRRASGFEPPGAVAEAFDAGERMGGEAMDGADVGAVGRGPEGRPIER